MKLINVRKYFTLILTFIAGFMLYIPEAGVAADNFGTGNLPLGIFNTGIIFLDIFLNNLLVCMFMALFGYLSGGLITLIVLFWNGYLISIFLHAGIGMMKTSELIYASKHIPFEFLAIFMFGKFGLKGFEFYKAIFTQSELVFLEKSDILSLRIPIFVLFIAAIIEIL